MKKKLVFVTSSRADFGKMYPLIDAAHGIGFDCTVFCTGAHFRDHLGNTCHHVKSKCDENGWRYYPSWIPNGDMSFKVSDTSHGLSMLLRQDDYDLVVIHGDRAEALGAAMCSLDGYRVAHVEGGEITSTTDEIARHSITKLAHWHLVASKIARNRVLQMGERKDSVFIVGSPDMDVITNSEARPDLKEVFGRYPDLKAIDPKRGYGIAIYHPVSGYTNEEQSRAALNFTGALKKPKQWVMIGSNDDPGWESVNQAMRARATSDKGRVFIPSMRFEYFITLLEHAYLIAGNSSCGIMEAPPIGVPTVDVGPRQDGRAKEFGIKSIEHVQDTTESEISHAIDTYWGRRFKPDLSFGDGETGLKFAQVLASKDSWEIELQKQFVTRTWRETPKYSKRRYV